jgi:hypothetical protein
VYDNALCTLQSCKADPEACVECAVLCLAIDCADLLLLTNGLVHVVVDNWARCMLWLPMIRGDADWQVTPSALAL